jgi:hypothetical protein
LATTYTAGLRVSEVVALNRFGRDLRQLGGDVGVTAVLHTWGQTLAQHVHVHCVVTSGALAPPYHPASRGSIPG